MCDSYSIESSLAFKGRGKPLTHPVCFQQFTEHSIKAVMLSQHEAKALGRTEVSLTVVGDLAAKFHYRGHFLRARSFCEGLYDEDHIFPFSRAMR